MIEKFKEVEEEAFIALIKSKGTTDGNRLWDKIQEFKEPLRIAENKRKELLFALGFSSLVHIISIMLFIVG